MVFEPRLIASDLLDLSPPQYPTFVSASISSKTFLLLSSAISFSRSQVAERLVAAALAATIAAHSASSSSDALAPNAALVAAAWAPFEVGDVYGDVDAEVDADNEP